MDQNENQNQANVPQVQHQPPTQSGQVMYRPAINGFIWSFFCGIVGLILSIKAKAEIDASAGTLCFTGSGGPTPVIIH